MCGENKGKSLSIIKCEIIACTKKKEGASVYISYGCVRDVRSRSDVKTIGALYVCVCVCVFKKKGGKKDQTLSFPYNFYLFSFLSNQFTYFLFPPFFEPGRSRKQAERVYYEQHAALDRAPDRVASAATGRRE